MRAMPGYRALVLTPTGGDVANLRVIAHPVAQIVIKSFLKIFFCRRQVRDLRQILPPPGLTTRQSAAKLSICLGVCAINSRFPGRATP